MPVRDFLLPDLGEGLEDAEVVTWRVAEGDQVELNQTLVEVNTAKALVEIPAPWAGRISKLHAAEGDVVTVGAPLVSIEVAETASDQATQSPPAEDQRPKRRAVLVGYGVEEEDGTFPAAVPPTPRRATGREGPVAASPPVRRLARERGVDLAALTGTGPGGRVTREDVLAATGMETGPATDGGATVGASPPVAPKDVDVIPVKGTRRLIAERMARSAREIPHVTTFSTVDAFQLQAYRRDVSERSGDRISPLPVVVRALLDVITDHPTLNASFRQDASQIWVHRRVHVGIATDTERGLLVPVIRDAGRLGVVELAREIARLSQAARSGTATPDELVGSTITVTNVGTFGAEFGTPIINHPEAAILALGVLEDRALVVDGAVAVRPAVTLSLSFDHRVLDGAEAGRALHALVAVLESAERLSALTAPDA